MLRRCVLLYILLCLSLGFGGCSTRTDTQHNNSASLTQEDASGQQYDAELPDNSVHTSFEFVTDHIDWQAEQALIIARPAESIDTSAENYYITGLSDPSLPLLLDGKAVEHRGVLGSFGVFVPLQEGENIFEFAQGDAVITVSITRTSQDDYTLIKQISRAYPQADEIILWGEIYTLTCIAPSGGEVYAKIGDKTIPLAQRAATAIEGVPATFVADFTPPTGNGIEHLGPVEFTLKYQGEISSAISEGALYISGENHSLVVRAKETSATVFEEESGDSAFYATLKKGAVDKIDAIGEDMYKLHMGGWVYKESVEPLLDSQAYQNTISAHNFKSIGRDEQFILSASVPAPYKANWNSDSLELLFFNTSCNISPNITGSMLISHIEFVQEGNTTVLTFHFAKDSGIWGYLVEYEGDKIIVTFRDRPVVTDNILPLKGIRVALDPGHGGSDPGAFGVAMEYGAAEKEINRAIAESVRKYLVGLGAEVTLLREGDDYVNIPDRMAKIQELRPDVSVSLHSNSVSYTANGTDPSGVEVYYYEAASKRLAELLTRNISENTGRKDRGAKHSNFKVTLQSIAPSVMIEMGFLTNPVEYDNLRDKQAIYYTALSVGESIVQLINEQ